MKRDDLSFFCCLSCKADLNLKIFSIRQADTNNIEEGVLFCSECKIFYPIHESIPFLLDRSYYKDFDIQSFLKRWTTHFDFNNYKPLDRKVIPEKLKQLNFYNSDSANYDSLVSYSKFWKVSDWNILHRWFSELSQDSIILDIGCGTGRCTIPLAKDGKRIIGTDISIGMLRKAIMKSTEAGLSNITYFLADAEDLPLKTGLFSAVISFGLLHHVNNPVVIIRSVGKLLKNNGTFYALENNASLLRPIFDILMRIFKLWNEEAGSYPLFKLEEVKNFIKSNGLHPMICTSTFLPPHLFNFMSHNFAKKILFFTDYFFSRIPIVSNFGGQLVIKATKTSSNIGEGVA
jgi:ubiquinone/menaquinone biosynthesis C-methylase UbiE/uncharacterized protein YbaR (Trm112 family)